MMKNDEIIFLMIYFIRLLPLKRTRQLRLNCGLENDITEQQDLYYHIMEECTQDIEGEYANDEKFYKLIFERKFAFKTYEEAQLECLKILIELIKTVKN